MSGLAYAGAFENVTLTDAAQDVILIATSASVPIWVHLLRLTSDVTTDVRARIQLLRRSTAGTGGSAVTFRPKNQHNTRAAAATMTIMRTTPGTAGDVIGAERWPILTPMPRLWTPEMRIQVAASSFLAVYLAAGTGGARNVSGEVEIEE